MVTFRYTIVFKKNLVMSHFLKTLLARFGLSGYFWSSDRLESKNFHYAFCLGFLAGVGFFPAWFTPNPYE